MIQSIPVGNCNIGLGAPSIWDVWVNRIMEKIEFKFVHAALCYQDNGVVAAQDKTFKLAPREIKKVMSVFPDENGNHAGNSPQRLVLNSVSYIIKSTTPTSIVAFNGNKYLLVLKSQRMCIVATCKSRTKHGEAAEWLDHMREKLATNSY